MPFVAITRLHHLHVWKSGIKTFTGGFWHVDISCCVTDEGVPSPQQRFRVFVILLQRPRFLQNFDFVSFGRCRNYDFNYNQAGGSTMLQEFAYRLQKARCTFFPLHLIPVKRRAFIACHSPP